MLVHSTPLGLIFRFSLIFFLVTFGYYYLPRLHLAPENFYVEVNNAEYPITLHNASFPFQIINFWEDLGTSLEKARPSCSPVGVEDAVLEDVYTHYDPLVPQQQRPDRLNMTQADEKSLLRAHYKMHRAAKRLGLALPYANDTTGIVITAGGKQIPILLVSLRMLRLTECTLPVEVFIGSWDEYNTTLCEETLLALNAKCRVISDIYEKAVGVVPLKRFQFKVFSILFSSFQNVLLLDADAFPAHDPTPLFASAPYTTHGLVTWPDFWASTASAHYFHIAGLPELPVSTRYSTESGQVLLDKSKHKHSLLMMIYYNYYGPDYYYPLLSQGSHGQGDKETFLPAAMAMDAPFYQVRKGIWALGVHIETFKACAMAQFNPIMDFDYAAPTPSIVHKEAEWLAEDLDGEEEAVNAAPKPIFIHQNMHKLDPERVLDEAPVVSKEGNYQRMWGQASSIVKAFGYDVEKRVWEVVAEEGCKMDAKLCERLREYFYDVFPVREE